MSTLSTERRRRPGGTGTVIDILATLDELRALVPDWEALAAEAAEPNPFYEHWMLLPALEAYGAEGFRGVAVWQDGALAGFFPMRLERGFRGLPLPALRSWRHRNMLVCTPLVRAKSTDECIGALLRSRLAPVVEFDWMSAGGPFYGALAQALAAGRYPWTVTDAYVRAMLRRERDPRERFNSNMRNNLRRWNARLAACGKVTPVRLAPGDDLEAWTSQFMRLEASGWKGRAGSALACREDDRRFVAAIFGEAFRRGRLHITGLDLDGRPLARHCMIAGGEGAFTFKIAYDEVYADCSPGIVAEVDNVRQFMETPGLRWIDSNTAPESRSYGRVWKDRRTVQRVAVGAHGAGRAAVAALPLLRLAKRWLRGLGGLGMRPGGTRPGGTRPPQRPVGLVLNPQKTQKPA
jgi:CelD/BcsL family acetyltransferase involved in cellulose biosynthesis